MVTKQIVSHISDVPGCPSEQSRSDRDVGCASATVAFNPSGGVSAHPDAFRCVDNDVLDKIPDTRDYNLFCHRRVLSGLAQSPTIGRVPWRDSAVEFGQLPSVVRRAI